MNHVPSRALVVLRVPHGSSPPGDSAVRGALVADRARLALPVTADFEYRVAGPYVVLLSGQTFDEYVAWEV